MTEQVSACPYEMCGGTGDLGLVAADPIPGVAFGGSVECLCCFDHSDLVRHAEVELAGARVKVRDLKAELRAAIRCLQLAELAARRWRAMPVLEAEDPQ